MLTSQPPDLDTCSAPPLPKPSIPVTGAARSITTRISTNFAWSAVSEATGKGLFFLTCIVLARRLGPSNFGLFTLAQTTIYSFWLLADLGIVNYGIREIARRRGHEREIINQLYTMRVVAGLLVFVIFVGFLFCRPMLPNKRLAFLDCGLYLLTYAFYTDWIFKGLERFKFLAFGSLISSSWFLVGTLILVKGPGSLTTAALLWSTSFLLGGLSLLFVLHHVVGIRFRLIIDWKIWWTHLKESLFFSTSSGLLVLYQYLPLLLVSRYFSSFDMGIFAAAYRIILTSNAALALINLSAYPVLSDIHSKSPAAFKNVFRKYVMIFTVLAVCVGLGGELYGSKVFLTVFGLQYTKAVPLFKILLWLIPLFLLKSSYGLALFSSGMQKFHNIAALVGVGSLLGIAVIVMPASSVAGASRVVVIADIAMMCALAGIFYYGRKAMMVTRSVLWSVGRGDK
jgi:O-antigen/teichoic acid export membrane protein